MRARSESVGAAWVVLPSPEADEEFEIIADFFNAQLDNDAVVGAKKFRNSIHRVIST
jgi:hypothetical protein